MGFNKKDWSKAVPSGKASREAGKTPVKPGTSGTKLEDSSSEISIRVIVRVRPDNERELQDNGRTVVEVVDDKMLIFDPKEQATPFFFHNVAQKGRDMLKKQNKQLEFIFDRVFDKASANSDVFEGSTKSLIGSLLEGYNCSVFAYGATGAGKTHTMLGNREDPGITYRTVAELFSEIETQSKHREFNLGVTYLEIYNENVQDLLHKSGPLHLREDGRCGVIVAGLEPIAIQSAEELLTLLAEGNRNRTQHPTDANKESSRSHAVFQVYVKIINKLDNQVQRVKLSMIDLAGSERASATGCKGVRFKEGANINKSLLALGNCINNLADGIKYIPYRDSKLTRLLKDSLGGNCRTVMIANIGPSSMTYEDTYNTLRYANRAKKIKSYAKKNVVTCETHVAGYIKIVEEQKKEIESLKSKLAALESGTLQLVQDVKPDKFTLDTYNKLSKLYDKKKVLIEKTLSLESSDKILAFRILYKKDADERLRNLTTVSDGLEEEQNASGKLRVNKSVEYFQRQRDHLRAQIEETWQELCAVETEIREAATRLDAESVDEGLRNKLSLRVAEIERCWIAGMQQHLRKCSSVMQCERRSINITIKLMSNILQNYYNIVKGYGSLTEKMGAEFKELIKCLEGFRNIKWSDSDAVSAAEDFGSFTCLGLASVDPLNSAAPIVAATSDADGEERDVPDANALNSTFVASNDKTFDLHDDESNDQDDNTSSNKPTDSQDAPSEKVAASRETLRKRALSDKNNDSGSTPPKQTKRPLESNRLVQSGNGRTGKENAARQKPVQMSEKSIAILNKLKSNAANLTTSHPPQHGAAQEKMDLSLKAMRNKERRGLMSTHPYHKPVPGKKYTPAKPSTRVPW